MPDSLAIIGAKNSGEGLIEHYFDSRGVSRELQMTLKQGTKTVWRDAQGVDHRFTWTFNDDAGPGERLEPRGAHRQRHRSIHQRLSDQRLGDLGVIPRVALFIGEEQDTGANI